MVVSTMQMLLRPSYPFHIVGSVGDAAGWLEERLGLNRATVARRVVELRDEYAVALAG